MTKTAAPATTRDYVETLALELTGHRVYVPAGRCWGFVQSAYDGGCDVALEGTDVVWQGVDARDLVLPCD